MRRFDLMLRWIFYCAILSILAHGAGAAEPIPVRVSLVPILDVAQFFAAQQEGYFTEEGLAVSTQSNQTGGAVGIPGTLAGAYDIAYSNTPTVLLALQQGLDLKLIAGSSRNPEQPPEQAALLSRRDDHLTSGAQYEGKIIAVNARNGVQWLFARAWVKATGGNPDKVTYREVPFPQMLDALKAKQADGVFAIDPFLTFGQRDPDLQVAGWPFHVVLPGIQAAVYVTSADVANKKPEMIAKFRRAMKRGAAWVNDNSGNEKFALLVNGYTKMDTALVRSIPMAPAQLDVDEQSVTKIEELMKENGLLKGDTGWHARVVTP